MRYWHPLLLLGTQLIVVMLLLCVYREAQIVYPTKLNNITHIHRTIYIDRHFNIPQTLAIQRAAARWTEATNHIADIETVSLPAPIKELNGNHAGAIIINDISPDFPDIIMLDTINKNSTCGVFLDKELPFETIFLVTDRLNDAIIEEVIMHEIGHSLGLRHLDHDIYTLMYPSAELMSPGITNKDLKIFCDIYHCDPTKLKNEEETLHF